MFVFPETGTDQEPNKECLVEVPVVCLSRKEDETLSLMQSLSAASSSSRFLMLGRKLVDVDVPAEVKHEVIESRERLKDGLYRGE